MNDLPEGLGERGARLWAAILGDDIEGDQHDLDMVFETCRVLDVIDDLAAAVERDGATTIGSRGQTVVHPAIPEMRQQQLTFSRLLGQLNLDEAQLGAVLTPRQASAKRAAQRKWRKVNEVRRGTA